MGAQVIEECGEGCAHWLDDGSEHPHRIALSMQQQHVARSQARLQELASQRSVKVALQCSVLSDQGAASGTAVHCAVLTRLAVPVMAAACGPQSGQPAGVDIQLRRQGAYLIEQFRQQSPVMRMQ